MDEIIVLPRTLATQLLRMAQQSPQTEVCGLVGARDGHAVSIYPVSNVAHTPSSRYHMEPAAQIDAMRRMREKGEELFAIYHSHPTTQAIPSAADLAEASYPDALYLIISLNTEGVLVMRGFYLRTDNVRELHLELE